MSAVNIESTNPKADVVFSSWAFVGFTGNAKSQVADKQHPIGCWTNYCDGRVQANAWIQSTPNAIRWEAEKLYLENPNE